MERNDYRPTQDEDKQTKKLIAELEKYVLERSAEVEKQTAEEYFTMLLNKGIEARKEGNYGIAAALVLRSGDTEVIVFGKNTVFSEQNPHGHAEMNAVRNAVEAMRDDNKRDALINADDMIVRESSKEGSETLLVTTLEPCPMCTVGSVISAKIDKVLIGIKDEYAGAMQEDRLASLAPLWASTARDQGLKSRFYTES